MRLLFVDLGHQVLPEVSMDNINGGVEKQEGLG
jgi:hypothetical protein